MGRVAPCSGARRVLRLQALSSNPPSYRKASKVSHKAAPGPIERPTSAGRRWHGPPVRPLCAAAGVARPRARNGARPCRRMGQFSDRFGGHAGDLGGALRRNRGRFVPVGVEADRAASNEAVIEESSRINTLAIANASAASVPGRGMRWTSPAARCGFDRGQSQQTSALSRASATKRIPWMLVWTALIPTGSEVRTDGALESRSDAGAVVASQAPRRPCHRWCGAQPRRAHL